MLARARARADAGMTETITVGLYRDAADPETGDAIRVLVTEHYTGPAQVKYVSPTVSVSDAPAQRVVSQTPIVKIPTTAPIVPEGDEIEVTASLADESLVGRRYTIDGSPESGQTSSHRYPVKELS